MTDFIRVRRVLPMVVTFNEGIDFFYDIAIPSREGVHAGEHELWFGGVGHKACQVTDFEGV